MNNLSRENDNIKGKIKKIEDLLNNIIMLSSKCAVCGSKKLRFIAYFQGS